MAYILMHKKIPVVELELDDTSCVIIGITEVMNSEHLPVGVAIKNNVIDKLALTRWWRRRAIPASRDGLTQALDELDVALPRDSFGKMLRSISLRSVLDLCQRQ